MPWWATAEGRRAWLVADADMKRARRCPPTAFAAWARASDFPTPWGSDVIAAYTKHIREAEALCRASNVPAPHRAEEIKGGIVLAVDSPGGTLAGLGECVGRSRAGTA